MRRAFHLGVRHRDLVESELDEEIRTHLAMRVERLVARGMSRPQAEAEALRRFGSLPAARAELLAAARHREGRLTMLERLDTLRADLRYTAHQIRRAPGFAAAVVATFALGIGANATMFGIVDRLLLRPPAHVVAPERLVRVETQFRWHGEDVSNSTFSYPVYTDLRDHVPAFAGVAMHTYPNPVSLGLGPDARRVTGMLVSGTYFPTLGVRAALGRALQPDDDRLPNGSPVVVIGDGLWRREFGGDRRAIGRPLMLGRRRYTIVGVAPSGFVGVGSRPVDVWLPVSAAEGLRFAGAEWTTDRTTSWMNVIARLAPGQSAAVAAAQATAAFRAGRRAAKPGADSTARVALASVLPQRQSKISPERRVAALLAGVSAFVLLIACANVANLLLVRAVRRRREIAVRLALGISRARLVRQLVGESLALALLGGAAALGVVRWGSVVVQRVLLSEFAWPDSPIDGRVLAFTTLAAMLVGVLAGLVPALQGSVPALVGTLKDGTRGAGVARSRTRTALLLTQAALSTVLLVGTGLFVRSLRNVHGVALGVDVDRVVVGGMDLRAVGLDSTVVDAYFAEARARVERLPGVASAAIADGGPLTDWSLGTNVIAPGRDSAELAKLDGPNQSIVSAGYFATVGTPIVRGRGIDASDTRRGAPPVVVVNEAAARLIWPGQDALAQCLHVDGSKTPCRQVIGIARDTHRGNIAGEGADFLQLYLPYEQASSMPVARALLVRAAPGVDADQLVEPVRRTMQVVLPNLPYANVRPMRSALERELRPWELGATMFGVFGVIALVLSALGLYGVVAHSVVQRTHEMGVRIALGARGGDIARLVLGTGFRIALAGVAIGAAAAAGAGRLVRPMLFNVSPRDPLVFATTIAVLVLVAAMASLGPARRASRADPLKSLRAE